MQPRHQILAGHSAGWRGGVLLLLGGWMAVAGAQPLPPTVPVRPLPVPGQLVSPGANPSGGLVFDAEAKEYRARRGEVTAHYEFYFTNTAPDTITINSVSSSCGCTTAQLPPMPWKLMPGEVGKIPVTLNFGGRAGLVVKTVTVHSSAGVKTLQVRADVPDFAALQRAERLHHQQVARTNRQAVFHGDCARCHLPSPDLMGAALYAAACQICHDAAERAPMVADLRALPHPTGRQHWQVWISGGKPGSLMPAWARSHGGPLTEEQVASLVANLQDAVGRSPLVGRVR